MKKIFSIIFGIVVLLAIFLGYQFVRFSNNRDRCAAASVNGIVSFSRDTDSGRIIDFANSLRTKSVFREVKVITKEEALEEFKKAHSDQPVVLDALKEVDNPFRGNIELSLKDLKNTDVAIFVDDLRKDAQVRGLVIEADDLNSLKAAQENLRKFDIRYFYFFLLGRYSNC